MSDINVQINPPANVPISINPPSSTPVTIGQGVTPHAATHAPGASDSLASFYVTGNVVRPTETGSLTGAFYPLKSNPSGYVQGAVVRPSNTGGFLDTGSNQTISALKNFTVRPTVSGVGVLLSGESAINTGSLTGAFYPLNANPSGYITGVDLSNYVTKSSTGIFVTTGQTGVFITSSQTGVFVTTGSTGSFIVSSQTGQFVSTGSTGAFVTGSVVRPSETGVFITTSQTGSFVTASQTGQFVSTGSTGNFVTGSVVRPSETGAFIVSGQTGVFVSASQTGAFLTTGAADGRYALQSATGVFITSSQTGQFVSTGSTGNFTTGAVVRPSETGIFVTTGQTGNFVTGSVVRPSETGVFITTSQTGSFITSSQTGQFVSTGSTGNFVTTSQTGAFATQSNLNIVSGTANSGYNSSITGIQISGDSTKTIFLYPRSGQAISGSFVDNGGGGGNTGELTGVFYPLNSNPSGYITGVNLSSYATTGYVTGVSGYLQNQISNLNNATGSYVTGSVVRPSETGVFITTGQTGQFYPTSNPSGFLTSGSPIEIIQLYAKNDQGTTIYKGQAVYINGANGTNPLIQLASNTGESTSSKTIGLLAQDLLVNEFGYVITEGSLEGFDTSSGAAGDPMWLGTGGNIIYGLANKPYGNNHLVYLGVVLRSQSNNGKVYVKVQNGFEIQELHRVYAVNPVDNSTLIYNSGSGSWFARQMTTGDVSGISNYALAADTGSFVTTSQTGVFVTGAVVRPSDTGAFLTTGAGDSRYALQSATGSFITTAQTGAFAATANTGAFLTTGAADGRYALQSATGNFVTTSQTGSFITTSQTGQFVSTGATGSFLTTASQFVQEIYIDAAAMLTGISGATPTGVSVLNSGIAYDCYSFDPATTGFTQFKFALDDYNLGDMKAKFHWTAPGSVTGGVVWGIQSRGVGDGEFLNSGFAGGSEVADIFSTGTGLFTSSAIAFTPSGTLSTGDLFMFRVYRNVSSANDDLAVNAYLLGVSIQYTGNRISAW